jgi:CSLREA domain-containing protein
MKNRKDRKNSMKKLLHCFLFAALFTASSLIPLPAAHAATFTVSNLADTNDGICNVHCSLREAITAANSAAGDDVITFTSNVRGAIDLTSTLPNLLTNISIQGPGANLLTVRRSTAAGTPDFRILNSNGVVSLSGLTFSNGRITGNGDDGYAGAIGAGSYGMLTIQDCVFSHNYGVNGGAIYNEGGTLLIYNSTFTDNIAVAGGALLNQPSNARTLISQCTFSGNTATKYMGGAILNLMPLAIEHCTFSGNSAPSGAGIYTYWALSIKHTILANNGRNIETSDEPRAQITSQGYNLANDDGGGFLTGPGDLINTNPFIGSLQNNGGPTLTHALLAGSPAINAGDPNFAPPPTFDQRGEGFPRVQNGRIDIGAFETEVLPKLSISNTMQAEGSSGATSAIFTVTLSETSVKPVTVEYVTGNGTAIIGSDFNLTSGTLTFAVGQNSAFIHVPIIDDVLDEANEIFSVVLKRPANATIDDALGIGTIADNDAPPSISIADAYAVTEGDSSAVELFFHVNLSEPSGKTIKVSFTSQDITATAPDDYFAINSIPSGPITFPPGATRAIISVTIRGDTLDEINETLSINLSAPVEVTISDSQGIGVIMDDDRAPTLFLYDSEVFEGTGGVKYAIFGVRLSAISGQTVRVNAIPTNGSAKAPDDFALGEIVVEIPPGQLEQTFVVPIQSDALNETDELFYVILSSPVNATIARGRGICTILDDDAAPTISIDDISIKEYNSGQATAALRLRLSAPSGQVVRVSYATANGTATAGSDYVAVAPTSVAFNTGSLYAYARVLINGDLLNETNETFLVNLSNPTNATIADAQGVGTILNDDSAPALSINDVSITEGSAGTKQLTFTVTLTKASGQTVTVKYATADGTAQAASDYAAKNGTLTFAPGGVLTQIVNITINGDAVVEPNEAFYVFLSGQVNAAVSKARGVGTITNDDSSG